ncbi:DUF6443 domain-containing protein [uncultured Psychroserpens sp.]|uniref:DUF6443 domain-containing protein n=1 Tax=uncultured Psychroserpens sp. TaxID=255436 RepID=UPI002624AB13|nr:DUF6443 domain-containing protein [uncultured Psychroserpens sp.]
MARFLYSLVILILLFLSFNLSNAQAELPDVSTLVSVPNSPEAEAFVSYGNTPISYYVGRPNISIPIHSIEGREMSVPVSLTYDASGIKVQSISTNVGAGWNLNAGGMVVRRVNGFPDDIVSGDAFFKINSSSVLNFNSYLNSLRHPVHNYTLSFETFEHTLAKIQNFRAIKMDHELGEVDLLPDTFDFNAPGLTGSVMIDPATGIAISIDDPDLKITYTAASNGSINSWNITSGNGTIYYFNKSEITFTSHTGGSGEEGTREYNSAWYLTKIESPTKNDVFDFTYSSGMFWNQDQLHYNRQVGQIRLTACFETGYDPTNPNWMYTTTSNLTDFKIKQSELLNIRLNGREIIKFHHLTNRLDLSGRKELDKIDIKEGVKILKTFTLNQSYFTANSTPTDEKDYRLKLDGITIHGYDTQGNAVLTPAEQVLDYTFNYIGDNTFPSRNSLGIDYLGYYNGVTNNTSLIPKYTNQYGQIFFGANREPNFNFTTRGMLEEIFYPTGGSTKFTFDYLENITTTLVPQELAEHLVTIDGGVDTSADESDFSCDDTGLIPNTLTQAFTVGSGEVFGNENEYYFDVTTQGNNSQNGRMFFIAIYKDTGVSNTVPPNVTMLQNGDIQIIKHGITVVVGPNECQEVIYNSGNSTTTVCYDHYSNYFTPTNKDKSYCEILTMIENNSPDLVYSSYSTPNDGDIITTEGGLNYFFPGDYKVFIANSLIGKSIKLTRRYVTNSLESSYTTIPLISKISDKTNQGETYIKTLEYLDYTVQQKVQFETIKEVEDNLGLVSNGGQSCPEYKVLERYSTNLYSQTPYEITYPKVKETIEDDLGNKLGSTVYEYYNQNFYTVNQVSPYPIAGVYVPKINEPYVKTNPLNGQLKQVSHYNKSGQIVRKELSNYEFEASLVTTGTNFFSNKILYDYCPVAVDGEIDPNLKKLLYLYTTDLDIPAYKQCLNENGFNPINGFITTDPYSDTNIQFHSFRTRLIENISKDYVYDSTNAIDSLTQKAEYAYGLNHNMPTQVKNTLSNGNTVFTNTKYPEDFASVTPAEQKLIDQHRIATPINTEILVKDSNDLLLAKTTQRNVYNDWGNDYVASQDIQTAKGNDTLEDRVTIHSYDIYGNPLEVSKADGTHIIYVWGYSKVLPIAKIENATYVGLASNIQTDIDAAKTASNLDTDAASENTLRTALNTLRGHFPDAMVSTYTYDPLVGVTSMTDPRGYTMFYEYDHLNRLKQVKDDQGYLLSTNAYVYGSLNYVDATAFQVKTTDGLTNASTQANLTDDEKIESRTYYDGLGRPMQSIAKQAGGNKQDIITPIVYDAFARQTKEYLPFARSTSSLTYESPSTLMPAIDSYYATRYPDDIDGASPNPFSETRIEDSPLNRILEQGAPGEDWAVDAASDLDHTIKFEYHTNSSSEVEHYSVFFPTLDTEAPQLFYNGHYAANELFKTITKDENWQPGQTQAKAHTVEEFKNKQGQVVLKRTYGSKGNKHDTNYVYDDYGNLSYVLSPKGSDNILASVSYTSATYNPKPSDLIPLDKLGVPVTTGTGAIDIIINAPENTITVDFDVTFNASTFLNNGAVFLIDTGIPNMFIGTITANGSNYAVSVQDGYLFIMGTGMVSSIDQTLVTSLPNHFIKSNVVNDLCYQYHYDNRNRLIEKKIPQKGWEYIVYDKLDRPVLTQDANLKQNDDWLFTKYDAVNRPVYMGIHHKVPSGTSGAPDNDERKQLQYTLNTATVLNESSSSSYTVIDDSPVYYTNSAFPNTDITELHTINYYDDYNSDLTSAFADPNTVFGVSTTSDTRSLPTGSKVKVLDTSDWITTVTYYDEKGQSIFIGSENEYLDTTDQMKNELDFTGKVLKTESTHTKGTNADIVVTDRFTYDHASRLKTQKQQIGSQAEELISNHLYDDFGQLVIKSVGNTETSPLQSVDYNYNIRGWLKDINDINNIGNDLFTFKINYNDTDLGQTNDKLYNGNISETIWKTANDISNTTTRGYAYQYDALNRLKVANMSINTGTGFTVANGYHSNGIVYDKNGNIMRLQRTGTFNVVDDLTYTYDGNQLLRVSDNAFAHLDGFKDGNTVGDDYSYDDNGNMIEDKNKNISTIAYNHLNLPTTVTVGGTNNGSITYVYDATGVKLTKAVIEAGSTTTTKYAGNYIYEQTGTSETLQFFSHPEGYVEPDGSGNYDYIYQYKDHLGNVRLSYSDTNDNYISFVDNAFYQEYEGWSPVASSANGSIELENNRLKVNVIDQWNGAFIVIGDNFGSGEQIDIHLDVDKGDTNVVRVYLVESEQNYANPSYYMLNNNTQTGSYTYTHTTMGKPKLRLVIDKSNTNLSELTHFYIDNVYVSSGDLEIIEENNYYPFGLKHKGYNNVINGTDHRYGFGGKEEQDELGLEWMDFHARNYDAALGRWMNLDPLAEQYFNTSPYSFALNNPIFFTDPSGEEVDISALLSTTIGEGDKKRDKTEDELNRDKWLAAQLVISLSDISGQEITIKTDKNGKSILVGDENPCETDCNEASAYISHLLSSDTDTIKVSGTDFGSDSSQDGSAALLDGAQINGMQEALKENGFDERMMSVGMAFLHESLHLNAGADFFSSEEDEANKIDGIFKDNVSSKSPAGPTTDIVNRFREGMRLPIRSARGSGGHLHVTKDGNKKILKVTNIKPKL